MDEQARVGFENFKDLPASKINLEDAFAAMDALHPDAQARYSWAKLRVLLSKALAGHHIPVLHDTPALPMIRGRAIEAHPATVALPGSGRMKLLTHIKDLGPIPKAKCNAFGRCHVPKSPVFYASFNEDTVLSELRPALESVVYFLTCVPKRGVNFKTRLIGELDYVRRYGRSSILSETNPCVAEIRNWVKAASTESDYVRLITDAFIAEMFQRRVENEEGYKATSALSALLLELESVDSSGDGEALFYPSIAHRGGMNIAMTRKCFESKVVAVSCKAVLVQRYYGYGIYKAHTLAETKSISDDGVINWQ